MLQRKAKNPRGPVPICPGGKFLPDPRAGDRLFPEHVSKTCLLVPQAGHASQKMPEPCSRSTWSHLRGLPRVAKRPRPDRPWGQESFPRLRATSGCSKALGPRQHLCIPLLTAAATGSAGSEDGELCSAPQEGVPLVLPQLSIQKGLRASGTCRAWWFFWSPAAWCSLRSSSLGPLQLIPAAPGGLRLGCVWGAGQADWGWDRGGCPFYSAPGHCDCCVGGWWHCDTGGCEGAPPPCAALPLGPASFGGRPLGRRPRGLCCVTESSSLAENKPPCVPTYPRVSEGLGAAGFNF